VEFFERLGFGNRRQHPLGNDDLDRATFCLMNGSPDERRLPAGVAITR